MALGLADAGKERARVSKASIAPCCIRTSASRDSSVTAAGPAKKTRGTVVQQVGHHHTACQWLEKGAPKALTFEARAQADIDLHMVWEKLQKCPQKAGAPDGSSYAMPRSLPYEAIEELTKMMRKWELDGVLPEQVKTTLAILLTKKPAVERWISFTSVLYRAWFNVRWAEILRNPSGPHEVAQGGSGPEVGRSTGQHTVSLLLGLQNFYDNVDLEALLDQWGGSSIPFGGHEVHNMVMERYTGVRLLQDEAARVAGEHIEWLLERAG